MICPKCGTEQIEPICNHCGYQFNPASSPSASENTNPVNPPKWYKDISLYVIPFLIISWISSVNLILVDAFDAILFLGLPSFFGFIISFICALILALISRKKNGRITILVFKLIRLNIWIPVALILELILWQNSDIGGVGGVPFIIIGLIIILSVYRLLNQFKIRAWIGVLVMGLLIISYLFMSIVMIWALLNM